MTKRNVENATIGQQLQVAHLRAAWFSALATAGLKDPAMRTETGAINPAFVELVDTYVRDSLMRPIGLSAGSNGWDTDGDNA